MPRRRVSSKLLGIVLAASLSIPAQARGTSTATPGSDTQFEFVDVAEKAGIDVVNVCGDPRRWYIPESNGCGAAWLDYDGDADFDLFVGNGAGMSYVDDGRRLEILRTGGSRLYRNDGGMRFTDVTKTAGAGRMEWINAVATGDVDNDGDPDLYLACFDADVFLRNDKGVFVDATKEAGLGSELWGAGAAFADVNGDGALDLYVANYCLFDLEDPPMNGKRNVIEGTEVAWGPEAENKRGLNLGAPDLFYFGDGKGHFREATREAGLLLEPALCSYAVVFSDVNADGLQDILVANDLQPSNLFINDGFGQFSEEGARRGFAFNFEGKPTSAMGLAVEDFDGDGDFDVFRTNFDFEANCLHVSDGKGSFTDEAEALGLAAPSMDRLGWGAGFFDADCDGDLDLLAANGHVYPQAERIGMSGWLMQSQLFEAVQDGGSTVFVDATARAGSDLGVMRSARGVAFADADDDGDVDALIVDMDEMPRLQENRTPRRGHWISVRTIGSESNRDGIGAVVRVRAGGKTRAREMRTTQGLYSSHDPRLHFGLGAADRVDFVEVSWPSGRTSRVENPPTDKPLIMKEPTGASP
jgi:hypothetical protein